VEFGVGKVPATGAVYCLFDGAASVMTVVEN
jgi:hypothetical protein